MSPTARGQRLALGAALCLAACSGGAPAPSTSYLRDVQPLVERSCLGCHRTDGIGPYALDQPANAQQLAGAMLASMQAGRMPPFYASTDCNAYKNDPRFSAAELALFGAWVGEGAPLGSPSEERHAERIAPPVVRHDLELSTGLDFDVTSEANGLNDNYHCFVLDPAQATDVMVTGYEVTPGNLAVDHHVLAYVVGPPDLPTLQALDDADPGPGYKCQSAGVGVPSAILNQIAGWVPGQQPVRLPAGSALQLPAGSKIVMQVHYNLSGLSRPGSAPYDQTRLAFELAASGSLTVAKVTPMLDYGLDIKAGDPASVQSGQLSAAFYGAATIYGLMGHMHLLGTEVKLELLHPDAPTECLLDVKGWDFEWQRSYELQTPVKLSSTDRLRITCTYDNSQAHQPLVNGSQQLTHEVFWGESTFDEMCMTYMTYELSSP